MCSSDLYKKKTHYNEWEFVYDPLAEQMMQQGAGALGGGGLNGNGVNGNGMGGNGLGSSGGFGNNSGGFGSSGGFGNNNGGSSGTASPPPQQPQQ